MFTHLYKTPFFDIIFNEKKIIIFGTVINVGRAVLQQIGNEVNTVCTVLSNKPNKNLHHYFFLTKVIDRHRLMTMMMMKEIRIVRY